MKKILFIIAIVLVSSLSGIAGAEKSVSDTQEIFIQEAKEGTFVADDTGNYTLSMSGVIPYTIYFTDRPLKNSGLAPIDEFIAGFNWDSANPPNGAIMVREAGDTEDIFIGQLMNPVYNASSETLTYTVVPLSALWTNTDSEWLSEINESVDKTIPAQFGQVILVIDGCPCVLNYNDCGPDSSTPGYPWTEYCNSQSFKWYKVNCDWDGLCCSKCYI